MSFNPQAVNRTSRGRGFFKLLAQIDDPSKRNIVRGCSTKRYVSPKEIDEVRRGSSLSDSVIIGAILKGPDRIQNYSGTAAKKCSRDLATFVALRPLPWRNEICYTAGYLNSQAEAVTAILALMRPLARMDRLETHAALDAILRISREYGASNYLSYKLAYLRSSRALSAAELAIVSQIEEEIGHRDHASLHFSALENLSSKISLFVVARRRVSGLSGKVGQDFRKALSLSNFAPTPLNNDDIAAFLLRATESCLIDTIYCTITLLNLAEEFPSANSELASRLAPSLLDLLRTLTQHADGSIEQAIVTDVYRGQGENIGPTMDLYRVSAAFLERPALTAYRNRLDRVIGARLLAEVTGNQLHALSEPSNDKEELLADVGTPLLGLPCQGLDSFYRTYVFLRFIGNHANMLRLSTEEVRFIFDNTVALEALLTEAEMQKLYLTSTKETKGLVSVLALALFRKKVVDPDVDFQFRADFIAYVNAAHNGSILEFIRSLLRDSPEVANYIAVALDEVTLEKMYSLIENASQASAIRRDILNAVGQRLNRIEYIIEADGIATRTKVARLQRYFDSSRIYVDSIAMKKWLDSNSTIATEQYRALFPRLANGLQSTSATTGKSTELHDIEAYDQDEYLVAQIAKDAFEQFCLNNEFGIQSYLGRRIRHNTLDGVTMDSVDAVLQKRDYEVCLANVSMRRAVEAWKRAYREIVDRLRREQLQFKPSSSLFKATLDPTDIATKENLRKLCQTLRATGAIELLNDVLIAFCWQQIGPQLESASRFIRTTLLREASESIDKYFSGHHGIVEAKLKADLHEAIHEVFKKVADWFQVPQTGFIAASVHELQEIIQPDLGLPLQVCFFGNAGDKRYTGISVHRLYDCLAVLLQNAAKHADRAVPVTLNVMAQPREGSVFDLVTVELRNKVTSANYVRTKERLLAAVAAEAAGDDMVTEGYTGIKKIKFITRASEGHHTLTCQCVDLDEEVALSFQLHAEAVVEEGSSE